MEDAILTQPIEEASQKKKGLTGYGLKLIAVITMFIDHAAAILYEGYMNTLGFSLTQDFALKHGSLLAGYILLRAIGRIAFPIYIFLLVQGFGFTKSKSKYALRLFIFALISEIPFNFAFGKGLWDFQYQNVFWTLLFGFLFMWFSDFVHSKDIEPWVGYISIILSSIVLGAYAALAIINTANAYGKDFTALTTIVIFIAANAAIIVILEFIANRKKNFTEFSQAALSLLVLGLLMFAGDNFHTDYGAFGVLAIAVMYACRNKKTKSFGLSMIPLILASYLEVVALIDLIMIKNYNGEKGRSMKYFFYAFYPAHILILYLIAHFIGLR